MDPVYWLAIGIVVAASLLGIGWWARGRVASWSEKYYENELDDLLAQLAEANEQIHDAVRQGDAGVRAMGIIVGAKQRALAARRASSPRERRRLLLGGDQGPSSGPASPGESRPDTGERVAEA
jgi:hypothetical protein